VLTRRGKLALVAVVAMWAAGRTFGIDELAVAAVTAVVLIGLAMLATWVTSGRLTVSRSVRPVRLYHDTEGTVELEVRNDSRLPTATLLIEDAVAEELTEPPRFALAPLRPGGGVRLRYTLVGAARGRYRIGPARATLRDPFGLAERRVNFSHASEVVVYPELWRLPSAIPRIGRRGATSTGAPRPVPAGGEFANVREYIRGDDLRRVHWKVTARRGQLMVRQEETPEETEATLVLDVRRQVHAGIGATSTFEQAVSAAASAARELTTRGYAIRLVTDPDRVPRASVPWQQALEVLADVESIRGASMRPIWQQLNAGAGGDGLLLALLGAPRSEELAEIVRAGRGFAVRAAVLAAPARAPRESAIADRASLAAVALRAAGWRVTVHRPGERLDVSWQRLGEAPGRARGVVV
jgi:uncharacterized protein (DUF58 family)